jgi:hypothetical protein
MDTFREARPFSVTKTCEFGGESYLRRYIGANFLAQSKAVFSYKNVRVRWGKLPEKVHFGANFLAQSKAVFSYKNVRVRWGKLSVKVTFRGTFSGRKGSFSITKGVDARGGQFIFHLGRG